MHKEKRYFLYLHERDFYDLQHFKELLHAESKYFLIDYTDQEPLFSFLRTVEDGWYPYYIIVDLYEGDQVRAFIAKLHSMKGLPVIPVLVLRDRSEDLPTYKNVEVFRRPRNHVIWKALVQKLMQ
jgi:hypothetical protein